jgi:hypothetical protein
MESEEAASHAVQGRQDSNLQPPVLETDGFRFYAWLAALLCQSVRQSLDRACEVILEPLAEAKPERTSRWLL